MNRRNFLSLFSAGIASIALEQAIPLGRVWSFPKKLVIPELSLTEVDWGGKFSVGDRITIRMSPRYLVNFPQKFIVTDVESDRVGLKLILEPRPAPRLSAS